METSRCVPCSHHKSRIHGNKNPFLDAIVHMRDLVFRLEQRTGSASQVRARSSEVEIVPPSCSTPWNIPPLPHNNHDDDEDQEVNDVTIGSRLDNMCKSRVPSDSGRSRENSRCLPARLAPVAMDKTINYSQYSTTSTIPSSAEPTRVMLWANSRQGMSRRNR